MTFNTRAWLRVINEPCGILSNSSDVSLALRKDHLKEKGKMSGKKSVYKSKSI